MASITDYVNEGLKYPFNDVKKILTLGAVFALLNLITFGISEYLLKIIRAIAKANGDSLAVKLSQIPATNIHIITLLAIVGFIVILLIMGYQYNVTKFSIAKRNDLPGFSDVLNLLKNGVKYFIVSLAYNILPIIVFILGMRFVGPYYNGDYIILILTSIVFIICNFLLIMALAHMISTDKFMNAFALKEITSKISNLGWVKYIGIIIFTLIVYTIIMAAVGIILMTITAGIAMLVNKAMIISAIISIIQGLFISSYISVFFSRVYGSIYLEANN